MASPIQIVVLAGGLGTRLRPLTDELPKAMIPVSGKPFIHYQLEHLAKCDIREVILSTGYLGHMIREFVQDGKKWGLEVQYVDEGTDLRGTAGALRLIYDQGLLKDRFMVTYGDSFLPIDFRKVWDAFEKKATPALMTVMRNYEQWDASNACFDGDRVLLYQKKIKNKPEQMQFIDYGLSVLEIGVVSLEIPPFGKYDLADLFHHLSLDGRLGGFEIKDRFYEIGSMQGIQDLEEFFKAATSGTQQGKGAASDRPPTPRVEGKGS